MGRPRAYDRAVLDAILFVMRSGCRWGDLPAGYGVHPTTAWPRLGRWESDGTWERIWWPFLASLDADAKLRLAEAFLDGTFVPAKGGRLRWADPEGQGDEADARRRRGRTPIGLLVESAQVAEVRLAEPTLATVHVARSRGRPRTQPGRLTGDRAHDLDPDRGQVLVREGRAAVSLPRALARKYPGAATEWGWRYVFPAAQPSRAPARGRPSSTTSGRGRSRPTSAGRAGRPDSRGGSHPTCSDTRSRPTCSNGGPTSGRSRSSSGTAT